MHKKERPSICKQTTQRRIQISVSHKCTGTFCDYYFVPTTGNFENMENLKILVCGDVEGNFKTLFSKVGAIHQKKGPFEFLLCVGDFFGQNNDEWEDVVGGKIKVPLATYILGPNRPDHVDCYPKKEGELVDDLIYLGKRGIFTGATGLKIAYLSGVEKREKSGFTFSEKDVTEMINSSSGNPVDILLTSQWPHGVTKHAVQLAECESRDGSRSIAYLAKTLKPRYHFSGYSKKYYERIPYRNHQILQEKPIHSTRFIGLAPVNNKDKQKWLYAFNILPFSSAIKELPDKSGLVTECPYDEEKDQFFFDMKSTSEKSKRQKDGNHKPDSKKQKLHVTHDDCWFCLTNPDLEKQLIISIGDHCYITIAKGGIVKDHLLIIPMDHLQATCNLQDSAEKEMQKYKDALVNYFHDLNKDVVFFERNFMSPHLQLQVIPVPKSKSSRIKNVVLEMAANKGLEFTELSKFSTIKQLVSSKNSYFYLEIVVNKIIEKRFMHIIEKNFPLQFGRMVLANEAVLNVPDRVDWKKCKLLLPEEEKVVENIKRQFEPYDFIT